ncbi:PH domain-containing protein [Embleya sp. NPDC020886]|uniref:PH domain-containing protein n=1 Tax=Embleya sp. NPDC020886 TaxID=3363980 RepID=UPI00379EB5B7
MVADRSDRREYRADFRLGVFFAVLMLAMGALVTVGMAAEQGWFSVGPLGMGVFFGLSSVGVFRLYAVRATIVDRDGVTIRGMFRTRVVAWPDVQGIEIEGTRGGLDDQPTQVVVLYDSMGRRYDLPNLNDVETTNPSREVHAIRDVWVRRRGGHWVPVAEVVARIAGDRRDTR